MSGKYLKYRIAFPHEACGREFIFESVEWPPKLIICPHCAEILALDGHDEKNGVSEYKRSGNYLDRYE